MNLTRKETLDNFVTEKIDVYKNNLLGNYDNKGVYFISPQIVDELIKLPKEQTSSFDNSYFCVGELLGYGEITFQLSFGKNLNDKEHADATLYLLEAVDKINGYVQNTIKTKLAVFENTVNNFMEKTFAFFSVKKKKSDDEGMDRKIVDEDAISQSYILAKKQYSLFLSKLSDEKCLDAYGKYFTARYTVLTRMNNPFSNAVLELFNAEYARIEKYFLKEKNYKILNELLDKCIEEISGTSENYAGAEKDFAEQTASALEIFTEHVVKIHEKMEPKALNMLSKDDKHKMEEINEGAEKRNKEALNVSDEVPVYTSPKEVSKPTIEKETKEKEVGEKLGKTIEKMKSIRKEVKKAEPKEARVSVAKTKEEAPKVREEAPKPKTDVPKPQVEQKVVEEKKEPQKEEKKDTKKLYSELFSYLNEQRKKTQSAPERQEVKEKEDDGMDM